MDRRIVAVVVSWNLRDSVLRCIDKLVSRDVVSHVVLVDNASVDGTPEAVRERFPQVEIVEMDRNTGFAAGSNAGIRSAMEHGSDFVLLVNSDVETPDGAVERLLTASIEEGAGAVGAKMLKMDDPSRLDGAWGVINWRNFVSRVEGEDETDGPLFSKRRKVDYPLGAFLLLNVEALEKVGLFDEDYFAYHEEMELCKRLDRAGYPVIYEPVAVPHKSGESVRAAGASRAREYLLARNSVRFVDVYGGFFQKLKFRVFVVSAIILKLPSALLTGKFKNHAANVHGWIDGFMGKSLDDKLKIKYRLETEKIDNR